MKLRQTADSKNRSFLLVSSVVIGLAFLMSPVQPGKDSVSLFGFSLPGLCYSTKLLGVPCPACGMTRGFVAFAHGRFSDAFYFHKLSPLLFLLVLVQIPWRIHLLLTLVSPCNRYKNIARRDLP